MAKAWAWSYSRLKNYETCPLRHYEIDIAKNFVEPILPGSPLDIGNKTHTALKDALLGSAPLPADMKSLQRWVDAVKDFPGTLMVEQKYAITAEFQPTTYFASDVWYRGIGDAVKIYNRMGLIVDWKTGKVPEDPDSPQLWLMAQCIFAHYPQVSHVRSEFVWLQEDTTTPAIYTPRQVADKWPEMLGRVDRMKAAHDTKNYPPNPSGLCKKYCPVTTCKFHGKGAF